MFKRLVFEDYAAICTIIAFAVVALVFLGAIWRALRMSRGQSEHMAALPFEAASQASAPASVTARAAALVAAPTSHSSPFHQAHDDEHSRRI